MKYLTRPARKELVAVQSNKFSHWPTYVITTDLRSLRLPLGRTQTSLCPMLKSASSRVPPLRASKLFNDREQQIRNFHYASTCERNVEGRGGLGERIEITA